MFILSDEKNDKVNHLTPTQVKTIQFTIIHDEESKNVVLSLDGRDYFHSHTQSIPRDGYTSDTHHLWRDHERNANIIITEGGFDHYNQGNIIKLVRERHDEISNDIVTDIYQREPFLTRLRIPSKSNNYYENSETAAIMATHYNLNAMSEEEEEANLIEQNQTNHSMRTSIGKTLDRIPDGAFFGVSSSNHASWNDQIGNGEHADNIAKHKEHSIGIWRSFINMCTIYKYFIIVIVSLSVCYSFFTIGEHPKNDIHNRQTHMFAPSEALAFADAALLSNTALDVASAVADNFPALDFASNPASKPAKSSEAVRTGTPVHKSKVQFILKPVRSKAAPIPVFVANGLHDLFMEIRFGDSWQWRETPIIVYDNGRITTKCGSDERTWQINFKTLPQFDSVEATLRIKVTAINEDVPDGDSQFITIRMPTTLIHSSYYSKFLGLYHKLFELYRKLHEKEQTATVFSSMFDNYKLI